MISDEAIVVPTSRPDTDMTTIDANLAAHASVTADVFARAVSESGFMIVVLS